MALKGLDWAPWLTVAAISCGPASPAPHSGGEGVVTVDAQAGGVLPPVVGAEPGAPTAKPAPTTTAPPATGPARRAAARRFASAGMEKLEGGDATGALQDFEQAHALIPAPTLLLMIGRAQLKLGRIDEAERSFEQVLASPVALDEPAVFKHARRTAQSQLNDLRTRSASPGPPGRPPSPSTSSGPGPKAAQPPTSKGGKGPK